MLLNMVEPTDNITLAIRDIRTALEIGQDKNDCIQARCNEYIEEKLKLISKNNCKAERNIYELIRRIAEIEGGVE